MIKSIVTYLGIVFIAVGIIGFFNNPVFGIFAVDTTHNLIHLVSGILAVVFGLASENAAKNYAKVLGVLYAIVTIVGFFSSGGMVLGMFASNGADTLLHLVLSVTFLFVGFAPATSTYGSMAPTH